jgi:hypothetical protein
MIMMLGVDLKYSSNKKQPKGEINETIRAECPVLGIHYIIVYNFVRT